MSTNFDAALVFHAAMLQHLADRNYFEGRGGVVRDATGRIVKVGWIETGMALKLAYGNEVGFDLWGQTHIDDWARADAPGQWKSFAVDARPGFMTIATIIKAAKDAGCTPAVSPLPVPESSPGSATAKFTGSGGDEENGKLFASVFRDRLLYVYETGEWLLFDPEQGWVSAPPGEADRAAKGVLANLRRDAGERYKTEGGDDASVKRMMAHVRYTSKANNLRAMIEMAKSERGMTVRLSDFDADPMLLGVANGVLDLRTGTLLPVSPDVLVSKRCSFLCDGAAAQAPSFDRSKAHAPDEFVICATPKLAELGAARYVLLKSTQDKQFAAQVGVPYWKACGSDDISALQRQIETFKANTTIIQPDLTDDSLNATVTT